MVCGVPASTTLCNITTRRHLLAALVGRHVKVELVGPAIPLKHLPDMLTCRLRLLYAPGCLRGQTIILVTHAGCMGFGEAQAVPCPDTQYSRLDVSSVTNLLGK